MRSGRRLRSSAIRTGIPTPRRHETPGYQGGFGAYAVHPEGAPVVEDSWRNRPAVAEATMSASVMMITLAEVEKNLSPPSAS